VKEKLISFAFFQNKKTTSVLSPVAKESSASRNGNLYQAICINQDLSLSFG